MEYHPSVVWYCDIIDSCPVNYIRNKWTFFPISTPRQESKVSATSPIVCSNSTYSCCRLDKISLSYVRVRLTFDSDVHSMSQAQLSTARVLARRIPKWSFQTRAKAVRLYMFHCIMSRPMRGVVHPYSLLQQSSHANQNVYPGELVGLTTVRAF
jgi:hypothetical protein